jgi:hypothetical protein
MKWQDMQQSAMQRVPGGPKYGTQDMRAAHSRKEAEYDDKEETDEKDYRQSRRMHDLLTTMKKRADASEEYQQMMKDQNAQG